VANNRNSYVDRQIHFNIGELKPVRLFFFFFNEDGPPDRAARPIDFDQRTRRGGGGRRQENKSELFIIIMAYTNVCGKKLQAKLGGTLNESATSHSPALLPSSQSFAKRQLEKMGWTEGTGLGKRQDGMQRHVVIKQREDEMGLGREKEKAREIGNVWWKDSVGGTLARLQQQKKTKKNKMKGDDGDETKKRRKEGKSRERKSKRAHSEGGGSSFSVPIRTYTDEELFEATGGARFGMRAQRRAEGKWKRTESGSEIIEMERAAKLNMEWNGRGSARLVVLGRESSIAVATTSTSGAKRRRRSDDDGNTTATISPSMSDEERDASVGEGEKDELRQSKKEDKKKKKKKKRKLERESSMMQHEVYSSSDVLAESGEQLKEARRHSKKKNKEKKSKQINNQQGE
jgi:Pin2-interacting protein X1